MIAVIPIGRGRPRTLPHVLRSLVQHAGITDLVTVGERPPDIEPDRHIDSLNKQAAHLNILGHLTRVTDTLDVDEFVWTDDDVFTLKPWEPGVYVRQYSIAKHLRDYPNRGHYSKAVGASVKLIRQDELDPEQVPCGPCHRPWLVSTERVREVVEKVEPVGGSFKTYYVAGLDDVIPVGDSKVVGRAMPKPDADVISTFNDSWKYNAGRILRETFTEPTRWESNQPKQSAGMAVAASGRAVPRHRRHRV